MNLDDLMAWVEEDFTGDDLVDAKRVAKDLAFLLAAKAGGKDIESELVHVKAQAMNLSAAAAEKVRQTFLEWSAEVAKTLVVAALA